MPSMPAALTASVHLSGLRGGKGRHTAFSQALHVEQLRGVRRIFLLSCSPAGSGLGGQLWGLQRTPSGSP